MSKRKFFSENSATAENAFNSNSYASEIKEAKNPNEEPEKKFKLEKENEEENNEWEVTSISSIYSTSSGENPSGEKRKNIIKDVMRMRREIERLEQNIEELENSKNTSSSSKSDDINNTIQELIKRRGQLLAYRLEDVNINTFPTITLTAEEDPKELEEFLREMFSPQYPADINTTFNIQCIDGNVTTLILFSALGMTDFVTFLLKEYNAASGINLKGTDNETNAEEMTALMYAASGGHYKVVELLLEYSARIEEVDSHSNTALSHAAKEGNLLCMSILLKNKANINHRNNDGKTPLMLLAEKYECDIDNSQSNLQNFLRIAGWILGPKVDTSTKNLKQPETPKQIHLEKQIQKQALQEITNILVKQNPREAEELYYQHIPKHTDTNNNPEKYCSVFNLLWYALWGNSIDKTSRIR